MPIDKKNGKNGMELGLDETSLNVLMAFFPESKNLTIKTIQERSGYSYEPVYRTLAGLEDRELINQEKVGKTLVYSLKIDKWLVKLAYYHYSTLRAIEFSRKYPKIRNALRNLPEDKVEAIIIFGSYSRGTHRKDSDIDFLVVTDHEKEVKTEIHNIKGTYPLDLQEIIVPKKEFPKIKKENKELWSSLVNDGIIMKGSDLFYYQAYQNEK